VRTRKDRRLLGQKNKDDALPASLQEIHQEVIAMNFKTRRHWISSAIPIFENEPHHRTTNARRRSAKLASETLDFVDFTISNLSKTQAFRARRSAAKSENISIRTFPRLLLISFLKFWSLNGNRFDAHAGWRKNAWPSGLSQSPQMK
jgi:hypothetical protein